MKKIKLIHYIGGNSLSALSSMVNSFMEENPGWQPFGPVVSDSTDEGQYYVQTLVEYEPEG